MSTKIGSGDSLRLMLELSDCAAARLHSKGNADKVEMAAITKTIRPMKRRQMEQENQQTQHLAGGGRTMMDDQHQRS